MVTRKNEQYPLDKYFFLKATTAVCLGYLFFFQAKHWLLVWSLWAPIFSKYAYDVHLDGYNTDSKTILQIFEVGFPFCLVRRHNSLLVIIFYQNEVS